MIKVQSFSPDTCTCQVQESWDDSLPSDQVTYTLASIIHRGPEHDYIPDDTLLSTLYEEVRRKNRAWNKAAELSGLPNDNVAWGYDAGRTLSISFPNNNVPNATKAAIQDWCDTNLVGPVTVG